MKEAAPVRHDAASLQQPSTAGSDVRLPLQRRVDGSPRQCAQQHKLAQLRGESTRDRPDGLPSGLRAGVEALSGMDMSGVVVHRGSSKPAQLNALAYAQGNDIHLAPGQEQHLPHEAWHVVQQRQGRVQPTMQTNGVGINDSRSLEREADVMGGRALQMQSAASAVGERTRSESARGSTVQRVTKVEYYAAQTYGYTTPPNAAAAPNANSDVGNGVSAHLDLTDPIRGSGVGGGAMPAHLTTDLGLKFPGVPGGWVQGHLLNSNLGGLGIRSNLFPITTAANAKHTSVEHEVKELLYNQPGAGNFNLANHGYVQYTVNAVPVAGLNNATTAAPDVDFNIMYRSQQSQPVGPVGPPVWNAPKNITITSRAAGNTPVPAAWTPFGAGIGMPLGGGGIVNVAQWQVAILTNPADPTHAPMLAQLGLAAPPAVPAGAAFFLTQQAPAGGLKIIGWQF